MADTAHKSEEEKKEYFDSPQELENKIDQLAQMILSAEHFVAFTGAGISTSAGIPDYRSGAQTVLPTGPGCWETAANIKKAQKNGTKTQQQTKQTLRTSIQKAYPTKCHMALVEMMEKGYLKHIISQNVDGLHRKSGIPAEKLSEVHGNTNLEVCKKCNRGYMRDFRVRNAQKVHDHKTGRKCDNVKCGGPLEDSIINFGENLNEEILDQGFFNGGKADLMLAIGSSLRVTPAADMAAETANKEGSLVIINLQKTPLDYMAKFIIHAKIDDVFEILMKKLSLQIPQFNLKRYAKIELKNQNQDIILNLKGLDENGNPYTIFKNIFINDKQGDSNIINKNNVIDQIQKIELSFQGHYNEPKLHIKIPINLIEHNKNEIKLMMIFNPYIESEQGNKGSWEVVMSYNAITNEPILPLEFKQIKDDKINNDVNKLATKLDQKLKIQDQKTIKK